MKDASPMTCHVTLRSLYDLYLVVVQRQQVAANIFLVTVESNVACVAVPILMKGHPRSH
eukprot:CAMPEP_0194052290 /NCGR_PEP_ID=MMETSP0009_2-20130614/44840_1 /TAXON_ID=210454 /ORGANISM="Grammatophora oceanica, Strain CCMP 410" /LENGTH=58 /DNA_ID=CAMNT_0038699815 /DNA_START=59 /DNA_END=235 /DNA_ORIENTATION=+